MCEQVRAQLRLLSLQLQSSDGSESATPVSEFANLVLQDDILWQLFPKANEELLLCHREDRKRSYPKSRTHWDVPATT